MFTGIALSGREFRLPDVSHRHKFHVPDQGGSQSPPENPGAFVLPTPHNCGYGHASTLEEPPLGLRSGGCLNASLHEIERERSQPPSNSCKSACEEQGWPRDGM